MKTHVTLDSIGALVEGRHQRPSDVLGPHEVEVNGRKAITVRAYLPKSAKAWIIHESHGAQAPMQQIHPSGIFEGICPWINNQDHTQYQIRTEDQSGRQTTMHDPYAYPPLLSEFDLYLLGEGRHWNAYNKLGAHPRTIDGVTGTNFAVWAPNADGVSVVGSFNDWDGRQHQMHKHPTGGVWELFVPDLPNGTLYKYRVNANSWCQDKYDPYGFAAEVPPRTAAIVTDLTQHKWADEQWMEQRASTDWLEKPISVYEVHLGSWKRTSTNPTDWSNYRDLAHQLVDYCKEMGFTHLELMPITEHPFTGSWGYQTTGYFAATSRYGTPEDFMYFVDYCHQNGIGVLLDWVPAHFPKDDHGLRQFDGSALYEHADPRQGEHPDWGTMIFNYGRNEVKNFLLSNALFWLDKYHIDGLRVDAVASMLYLDYSREDGEWIPNCFGGRENLEAISFLKEFNEQVHFHHPGVLTVAEESTSWEGVSKPTFQGGLGFSLKWNMGWMNDTLRYMQEDPIHRQYHHNELTFSMIYAFTENFALPFSHDEVVHGKGSLLDQMPGDMWQQFANLRLLYTYMWTHPGKKILFMGNEIAQWHEWNHDESLQWHLMEWESHQGMQSLVKDLNRVYCEEPALHQVDFDGSGFEWIDSQSGTESVLTYARKAKDSNDLVVVTLNFTPVPRTQHRIGLPGPGWYREIFNSDSERYSGSNVGSDGGRQAEPIPWHGREWSTEIALPPLGGVIFKATPGG